MRAMQFMDGVSQPIIAATNQLVNYSPFVGGYLLSNFIQPVYRLSRTPVSDETPFAGFSQACRQLPQPYRLFANDLLLQLLGRDLSLVANDRHLDASLSRDLEDAKQSSSVLCGESRPPYSQPGVSSPSKCFAAARLSSQVLRIQKMTLLTLVHLGNGPLLLRLSSQVLRIQKMTLHTLVRLGDGPTIPIQVHLGILLARGVILPLSRGVGSRTIRLLMRARRLQIADNGTISRMTRNIFVMILWLSCWTTS